MFLDFASHEHRLGTNFSSAVSIFCLLTSLNYRMHVHLLSFHEPYNATLLLSFFLEDLSRPSMFIHLAGFYISIAIIEV